jgi:short-subunit dehydrogenase involved in D-alanine esterification of teichoic acids
VQKIKLECNNSTLCSHVVDISNREDLSAFTSEAVYKCKNIYELINCTGIIQPFINLEKL